MTRPFRRACLLRLWFGLLLGLLAGCTDVIQESSNQRDGAVATDDAGEIEPHDDDAQVGEPDAGEADAGEEDAGGTNPGELDAGEAYEPDAGAFDAGAPSEPDPGELDAGDDDAGETDAGDDDAGETEPVVPIAPTASFVCSKTSGEAPLTISVSSTATPGNSAIVLTEYDFGVGFGSVTSATFKVPGSYTIWQRVLDANGLEDLTSLTIEVKEPWFVRTEWNAEDKLPEVFVSNSGLTIDIETIGAAGVRSTTSMAPYSGVHYFEASIPEPFGFMSVGVATARHGLEQLAGDSDQSFGIHTGGQVYFNGTYVFGFPSFNTRYGFVVDYRGATPSVRFVRHEWEGPELSDAIVLDTINKPLFVYAAGSRRTKEEQLTLHPGNDLTNDPFAYDPVALLAPIDPEAAEALVLGVHGNSALSYNEPPELREVPGATSMALGDSITFSASAFDAESGDLTDAIVWEDLGTGLGGDALKHVGPSFTFEPRAIGIHPIRVTVTDQKGKRARAQFDVEVGGSLPSFSEVHLVEEPGLSGEGITLSPDGYSARYSKNMKMGIRANQGLIGDFWYFEATRHVGNENIGVGLVIGDVSLNPYPFYTTPPSCSLNSASGIWRDLMFQEGYDLSATTYGFAVDFRDRYAIAHIIVNGTVSSTIHLVDATVPVYPMLYGNFTSGMGRDGPVPYDMSINLGQEPFVYDARAALEDAYIDDADTLRLCWGLDNAACL